MSVSAVEGLRAINGKLRGVLSRWQAEPIDSAAIAPQLLNDVLADLQNAAQWLSAISPGASSGEELEREITEYRGNALRMEQLLPRVQERMLAEKARLEGVRAHLAGAAAWAEGRRKIL
jgi:hypothetical protein